METNPPPPGQHILGGLTWIVLDPVASPTDEQIATLRLFAPFDEEPPKKVRARLREGGVRIGPVREDEARGFAEQLLAPLGFSWQFGGVPLKDLKQPGQPARNRFLAALQQQTSTTTSDDLVVSLIHDFKRRGWNSNPFERILDLVHTDPSQVERLLLNGLEHLPEGGTFLEFAVSFLPEAAFSRLAEAVIAALERKQPHPFAEALIARIGMQSPATLHAHLIPILTLSTEESTCRASRNSGTLLLNRLRSLILEEVKSGKAGTNTQPGSHSIAQRAWLCLLETRHPEVLREAAALARQYPVVRDASSEFLDRGFSLTGDGQVRQLYADRVYHLCFDPGYLKRPGSASIKKVAHPTWALTSPTDRLVRFGGHTAIGFLNHLWI